MRSLWLASLVLFGCDDYVLDPNGGGPPDTDTDQAQGWCGVQQLIADECTICHSSAGALGGLDLETNAHAALVGVASATDPSLTLVVASDPGASFLLSKIAGPLAGGQGTLMPPPNGGVDSALVEVVRAWIAEGAPSTCDEVIDTDNPSAFHAAGFDAPEAHGYDAKMQALPCVDCHGADLTGVGEALSCDGCHTVGWRTDCTFCHGGTEDGIGSPPRHISGEDDGVDASFVPHRAHTGATALHVAFDCAQCHAKPGDVLSVGHLFVGDTTPGVAETRFTTGLSNAGVWNASNGTCTNLYCHGNGRGNNGTMVHTEDITGCAQCHAGPASGRPAWATMSGVHEDHLREGVSCSECHADTVNAGNTITDVSLHVNKVKDVALVAGMTRTNGRCTGSCHGEVHSSEPWVD